MFLATGVVAWLRRPSNRVGPLLTAGAFVWLAAGLYNTGRPRWSPSAFITSTPGPAVLVHLLHAFPWRRGAAGLEPEAPHLPRQAMNGVDCVTISSAGRTL